MGNGADGLGFDFAFGVAGFGVASAGFGLGFEFADEGVKGEVGRQSWRGGRVVTSLVRFLCIFLGGWEVLDAWLCGQSFCINSKILTRSDKKIFEPPTTSSAQLFIIMEI